MLDVASEGLNLHYQAHRLIHFDIPWSLMVFQQRNGRVDRYGQTRTPMIGYLYTQPDDERIRGDLRYLEILVEKGGWRELLRHQAEWLWGLVDRHPGLAETFLVVTWAHHYFVRGMKTCIDALVERGFSPDDAVFAVDFIGDTVLCTHLVIEAAVDRKSVV